MDESAARARLHEERQAALRRVRALSTALEDIRAGSAEANTDDEHDPEGSTIAFERAQVSSLLRDARSSLADIDQAVARLAQGTYGTCERCGGAIAPERLVARPASRRCIDCAGTPRVDP
jgi:DnaK suppressor protein